MTSVLIQPVALQLVGWRLEQGFVGGQPVEVWVGGRLEVELFDTLLSALKVVDLRIKLYLQPKLRQVNYKNMLSIPFHA